MRGHAGLAIALLVAACAPVTAQTPPGSTPSINPLPYARNIAIRAEPVPLNPQDPSQKSIGNFAWAGGIHITSAQTPRLHGLSDLKVRPDGRVLATSDQSDVLDAHLVLDAQGRLLGLSGARLHALKDDKGVLMFARGQKGFDSEGIAELANGDRLVSYEQDDRLLLFPKGGGPPRPAPMPDIKYDFNHGMEALAAEPLIGPDAYRVGIESTGQTYICRLSSKCVADVKFDLEGLELAGLEVLPDGRLAYLIRDFFPDKGNVVRLRIVDRTGKLIDGMEIARPLTVDNFEGVAAVPYRDGRVRFYLIVDDNFGQYDGKPTDQRTLLFAFDWTPPKGK